MSIRYPAPLRPGDRIGVTSPSSGVPAALLPRLDLCVGVLRDRGYDVVVGTCMDGGGVVSAPAARRAPHLDLAAVAAADPTWLVGSSDISTLLLALTTTTGVATLHGHNLMDTPYRVPAPLLSWLDVVTHPAGAAVTQGAAERHRAGGFDRWEDDPTVVEPTFDSPGGWRMLDPGSGTVRVRGRLIGGCLETVSVLAGLDVPVVLDVDCGHLPPHLALVNGALAELTVCASDSALVQHLVR